MNGAIAWQWLRGNGTLTGKSDISRWDRWLSITFIYRKQHTFIYWLQNHIVALQFNTVGVGEGVMTSSVVSVSVSIRCVVHKTEAIMLSSMNGLGARAVSVGRNLKCQRHQHWMKKPKKCQQCHYRGTLLMYFFYYAFFIIGLI